MFSITVVLLYQNVVYVCVFVNAVHEPKWSLILASTGAVFAFVARLFSTHFMADPRKQHLAMINKTLDMKKIAHLDPYKTRADAAV